MNFAQIVRKNGQPGLRSSLPENGNLFRTEAY